jgi:hypothetical protein
LSRPCPRQTHEVDFHSRLGTWYGNGKRAEEGTVAETAEKYNGYCVKCKEKRDFQGNVEISKTGMRMAKGPCPVCGTTVNRILGKA